MHNSLDLILVGVIVGVGLYSVFFLVSWNLVGGPFHTFRVHRHLREKLLWSELEGGRLVLRLDAAVLFCGKLPRKGSARRAAMMLNKAIPSDPVLIVRIYDSSGKVGDKETVEALRENGADFNVEVCS